MNNKLFKNLRFLSVSERKLFLRWLRSPWANSNKRLIELFQACQSYYPDLAVPDIQQRLYRVIYPKKLFHKRHMDNLMSDLLKQLEKFLVHEHLGRDNPDYTRILIKVYDRKNQLEFLQQTQRRFLKHLNEDRTPTVKDHLYLSEGFELLIEKQKSDLKLKKELILLGKADQHLDQYYLLRKLRHLVIAAENSSIETGKVGMEKETYQTLKLLIPGNNNAAAIWYGRYIEGGTDQPHLKLKPLKQFFFERFQEFEEDDQNLILRVLLNMAARLIISGDVNGQVEMFSLYQHGLKTRILLQNNRLSPQTFINLIGLTCNLAETNYARQLVENYATYLSLDIQEEARLWALTKIAYLSHSPELNGLVQKLDHRNTDYQSFSLMIRLLITQIRFDAYYAGEEDIDDAFWNYNEAFTRKLQREKKFALKHIRALQKFSDFVRTFAKIVRSTKSKEQVQLSIAKVEASICKEKNLHAREWLLERVDWLRHKL